MEKLDTATPWIYHVPLCVTTMINGKHFTIEVPASVTIEESWQLVEVAEKYNKHYEMMENCNYGERELKYYSLKRKIYSTIAFHKKLVRVNFLIILVLRILVKQ